MSRLLKHLTFGFVATALAASATFGCESVVGIEDRTVVPGCDTQCAACEDYCDLLEANCAGENAVYQSRVACIGTCREFPLGDLFEPGNQNTLACRLDQVELAASTGEPNEHCPGAGPGGGGKCGTDCEAYCDLLPKLCETELTNHEDVCLERCAALKNSPGYSLESSYDASDIDCRLIHLSNVPTGQHHCDHAYFLSTLHCLVVPNQLPNCEDTCDLIMGACQGELQQYDSVEQCELVCAELEQGALADRTANTVGCRNYHAHSALLAPQQHCPHTSPHGAGHCGALNPTDDAPGGNCESYCRLAAAACSAEFAAEFDDEATCLAECAAYEGAEGPPVNEQYSVALAEADDALEFRCRILHVARAFEDRTNCAAAVGPGTCDD